MSETRAAAVAVFAGLCLAAAGCGGSPPRPVADPIVWLCRPGLTADPCAGELTATAIAANGSTTIERTTRSRAPAVDCFYVYPTVSAERTVNADLQVGFREREVALAQASRFSQVCRIYAPVYRQLTLTGLAHPARITLRDALVAYRSVLAAFRDYVRRYNRGRGFVLIGHSQGAVILIRLLQQTVDHDPGVRHRLVAALLLGGNLTTSDFAHIPPCRSRAQTGCTVAYSSFIGTPPKNSQFGRTTSNAGLVLLTAHPVPRGTQVVCVNPAAPSGGVGSLEPYLPSLALLFFHGNNLHVNTPWVSFPGEYRASCKRSGNASWLQIEPARPDPRPALREMRDAALGLHVLDVNIALGNLVTLVRDKASAYRHRH